MLIIRSAAYYHKIFYYAVSLTRQQGGSASMGFLYAILEASFNFAMIFLIMFMIRGAGIVQVRGEFGVYVLTGVALYMMHNKVISAVAGAGNKKQNIPVLGIDHGILIFGQLLHDIYMQTIVVLLFGLGIYMYYGGFEIENPRYVFFLYLLTIAWSAALGGMFYALKPFWSKGVMRILQVYTRIGMITSGKMIPGNLLMGKMALIYVYNPLYHTIDQMRGAVFVNYTPFNSDIGYMMKATIIVAIAAILIAVATKGRQ